MEAWDILAKRYHSTREIVDAQIKRLFSLPKVHQESAATLRKLIDSTTECIRGLKVLKEPVQHWNSILIHITREKLDQESRRQWELSLKGSMSPKFDDLATFLKQRARALAASEGATNVPKSKTPSSQNIKKSSNVHLGTTSTTRDKCLLCSQMHAIYSCSTLLKAPVNERWLLVKKHSLCYNCLRSGHQSSDCKSGSCKISQGSHNTLLHNESKTEPKEESTPSF